jgi:glycerophosphoryl diester phosphodiesterase
MKDARLSRYQAGPKPRLFAHRGASGELPENTLDAFEAGLAAGAQILELDVHASADGEIVVVHDATLERISGGRGLVREHSLRELKRLDAGYRFVTAAGEFPFRGKGLRIPTLAEVLERFSGTPLNIEIKQEGEGVIDRVLETIDRFGARGDVLVAAERLPLMRAIRSAAPDLLTGFCAEEVAEFLSHVASPRADYRPVGAALQVPPVFGEIEIVTEASVESAHQLGVEVHVWTINDPGQIERLLDIGVDAIMSDYPARAAPLLQRRRSAG